LNDKERLTTSRTGKTNRDWWPNELNLNVLHQNSPLSNPMGKDFNYAQEFKKLDLETVKKDLYALRPTLRSGGQPITATTEGS
jgi:catalase-peroxidase